MTPEVKLHYPYGTKNGPYIKHSDFLTIMLEVQREEEYLRSIIKDLQDTIMALTPEDWTE